MIYTLHTLKIIQLLNLVFIFFCFIYLIYNVEGDRINKFIEYYYSFKNIHVSKIENKYIFKYNGYLYEFVPVIRDEKELLLIDKIVKGLYQYDQIEKNMYQQLITRIYEKKYILIKRSKNRNISLKEILDSHYVEYSISQIDKSSWAYLWSLKVDNIEYQLSHIKNKYKLLGQSIDYYIGMAENAILYVKNSFDSSQFVQKKISHIRITGDNINDPQNIIIDYKSRDVSEYLKYIFFNREYSYDNIRMLLFNLNYNEISLRLLYARLFFPTFFFDIYDRIINGDILESELYRMISRVEEYEDYINNIYMIISIKKSIPRISWI